MSAVFRNYGILFFLSITIVAALSVFAHVPYIWSACGLAAWAAFGHLITLDDDEPGGWSNPEESKDLWRSSLLELAVKFVVLLALVSIALAFPDLRKYGG
ncbi:MAG TPA: hypothetical protein VMW56_15745 [Candidatus Margulisiibacteriota bacterium]|nr:hypothetical protein [Candidatus Margulisiibacteriota bacterium]